MRNYSKMFKRVQAMILVVAMLLSMSNLGLFLNVSAVGAGTPAEKGQGDVVAENYDSLTEAEKNLLKSGYLVEEVLEYTKPGDDDELIDVVIDSKTIKAETFNGGSGYKWVPTTATIIAGGSEVETVVLTDGKGTFTYDGNAFSVKVAYKLEVEIAEATQNKLLNAPAWLKQSVDNLDAISAQLGNLYILEEAMPSLVDLANNGVTVTVAGSSSKVTFADECKAAVNALNAQMTANGGKLNLSVMIDEYDASAKTEYLTTKGADMKAEVINTVAKLAEINTAMTTMHNNLTLFIENGWVSQATANQISTLANVTNNLTSALTGVANDPWTALKDNLIAAGANYAALDVLVNAITAPTGSAQVAKNPLMLDETTLQFNMSMWNLSVKVVLNTVEDVTGSTSLVETTVATKVFTLADGVTKAEIEANADILAFINTSIGGADKYVDGKFNVSYSTLPNTLTSDLEYVITYSPKNFDINFAYDTVMTVPYGYKLLLEKHGNAEQVYDYWVDGVYYAQGSTIVIKNTIANLNRTEGKPYVGSTLAKVVASCYYGNNATASAILSSGALTIGNEAVNVRYPDNDGGIVTLVDNELTAKAYDASYNGLKWIPYTYTVVSGSTKTLYDFGGAETEVVTIAGDFDRVDVVYRLSLSNIAAADVKELVNLPGLLVDDAIAQKTTLDKLNGFSAQLAQLDKVKLAALNGVIDAVDLHSDPAKNAELRTYFKGIVGDMISERLDTNNYFKLYNMLLEYSDPYNGGLSYYYKNSAKVIAEVDALSEALTAMLADDEKVAALETLCTAAGYGEYADKIKDLGAKMAEVKAALTAPRAEIDLTSGNLNKLTNALSSATAFSAPAYKGLYLTSDAIVVNASTKVTFEAAVNVAGGASASIVPVTFAKDHVMTKGDVDALIAAIKAAVASLNINEAFYTNTYNESELKALIGQTAGSVGKYLYTYTWTEKTASVTINGVAGYEQEISISDLTIELPYAPNAASRYDYYLNGVKISSGGNYKFTEADLLKALASGIKLERKVVDTAREDLIAMVNKLNDAVGSDLITFALVENGAFSIVMKVDASNPTAISDAMMGAVMGLINSGYSYIGMNDQGVLYMNAGNSLEISLQAVIDAIMLSGVGTDTLINAMDSKGNIKNMTLSGTVISDKAMTTYGGKLVETTMQLGNTSADAMNLPFYITLGAASDALVQARNMMDEQLGSYMSFNCADGKANLTLTMPQKAYEAYLAALLVTDNIDIQDINAVNAKIAVGFVQDFFNPVFDGTVSVQTITNTMNLFGYNVSLTQYQKFFDMMAEKYNSVEFEYDKTSGEITRKVPLKQIIDKLNVGDLAKMIKEYDTGLEMTVKASLTNLASDFEAMYADVKASGVTNKLGLTTNLAAKLNNLSGSSVIVLMSDIDGNLTFNNTTVLNLNGFTVNGNIKANGNLTIVDSSIGAKVGGVTGTITGNVTITGGEYTADVSAFLKSGYVQTAGVVANEFYSFKKDANGNLTIELDAGALMADIDAIPSAKTMLIDLAFDMLFNGYTTNKLEIAGSQVYNIALSDFVGIYTGDNRLSALAEQIGNMISSKELSTLINTLTADLTNFGNLKNAILNDEPIIAYDMTTASWNVVLEHITAGDYLTPSITSGEDQNRKLFVTITGSAADKQKLADMMGILDDTTDVNIKLDMDQVIDATNKDVTLEWSGLANVVVDLSGDHSYAVVFSILAADGISGPAQAKLINAIKTYYATGKIADLKNAFNALTTAQVVNAVKNLQFSDSFEDMVTGLGLDATVAEDLTKLENIFDNYAKVIAAVLRRTDYTGGSRTLGSFYKSDIGYGISRENLNKTFARDLFKGYGITLDTTITDLLISVELFNYEEAPEFIEGTGIPSVDANENIADVKIDTANKNIIIDAHSDGIKAAILESLLNFTALRYDTLTIEVEENANGLVYTGAKVTVTASSSTGTAVIEYTVIILGDVNGDGKASALDATAIANSYLYDTPLTEAQKLAADMNGNGTVNANDATLIVNKFLYWDEYESSL